MNCHYLRRGDRSGKLNIAQTGCHIHSQPHYLLTAHRHSASGVIRGVTSERKILKLSDYRIDDVADNEIDLITAVDVAIRDLREPLPSSLAGSSVGSISNIGWRSGF